MEQRTKSTIGEECGRGGIIEECIVTGAWFLIGEDVEDSLNNTEFPNWSVSRAIFEDAESEGDAQFRRGHFRIYSQDFVECRLPIPLLATIDSVKVIS